MGSPAEGQEPAPKPPFHWEREMGFTAQRRSSRRTAKRLQPTQRRRVVELTEGKSLEANIALIRNNAVLAAQAAAELARL